MHELQILSYKFCLRDNWPCAGIFRNNLSPFYAGFAGGCAWWLARCRMAKQRLQRQGEIWCQCMCMIFAGHVPKLIKRSCRLYLLIYIWWVLGYELLDWAKSHLGSNSWVTYRTCPENLLIFCYGKLNLALQKSICIFSLFPDFKGQCVHGSY